ncbi:MAG: PAS domain S-box protein [Actinomycetes bacterium]
MTTDWPGRVADTWRLEPLPESARDARELVLDALEEAGRCDLADAASLLVSELVTNAIVHARTTIELEIVAGPDGLRVAVRDGSPHLPVPRHYGRAATTGRGLELVDLLSDRHGTDTDPRAGKTVWFELGAPVTRESPTDDPAAAASAPEADLVVRLRGMPVRLALAWQQHADALMREHVLARWEADSAGAADDPGCVADDAAAGDAFSAVAAALEALGPVKGNPPNVDLDLPLRHEAVSDFAELDTLLEHVQAQAEQGQTLAPPTQPEVRVLRRWFCAQVRAQADGAAPEPWPGLAPESPPAAMPPVDWDPTAVRTATDAVVAADDVNRIVAASPAALDLLGWDDDLIGRRIAAVIPERLREAHIASFTLHLLTGETRILDREVSVPALRRDGTEVPVLLEVRRESAGEGRTVFLATFRTS